MAMTNAHNSPAASSVPGPTIRPRRLRMNANLRRMVRENALSPADFIYPLFIRHGQNFRKAISSMPGQYQISVDQLDAEIEEIVSLGLPAVILFGIPEVKDACGSDNFNPDGVVPTTIRRIKELAPELIVITDMCCCEYTDHGHCGIINMPDDETNYDPHLPQGYLLNDPTLDILQRSSVVHAQAGADIIAPSGMIDGMVGAIRDGLDEAGLHQVSIMSYAAKYASAFYGPFREAAESPPSFGDRSQYQMDPANRREALKEIAIDVDEGADMLMVKPGMPYLDILRELRDNFDLPTSVYQVSGEYAMIHAAAANGWLDLERAALESLMSFKRAGADMIITYFAKDAARWLQQS